MKDTYKPRKMVEVQLDQPQSNYSKVKTVNSTQIRYSAYSEMDSHLYKLIEAPVVKYIGKGTDRDHYPSESPDLFLSMGHAHIFRTIDSDGIKHTKSVPISGHYHLLELEFDKNDPTKAPEVVGMSGPMQLVQKKVNGRKIMVDEPLNHYDYHTHDIEYIKSQKISARSKNEEASKFLANESVKTPSAPSGISTTGGR